MTAVYLIAHGFLIVPFVILLVNNLLPSTVRGGFRFFLAGAAAVFECVGSAALFLLFRYYSVTRYEFDVFTKGTIGEDYFCIKRLTLFMTACVGIVVFVSVMLAIKTVGTKRSAYVNLLMCLLMGMNSMLMATDLFSLYVFLEIVGISSFVMIAMFRSRVGLEGSFKYLVVSAVGIVLLLVGLSFLFMQTGSLDYSATGAAMLENADASHRVLTYIAIALMISGFAVKAGAVPFHSWLPDAHQSADTSVSVLLSGIVIKVGGIYGLIVVANLFGSLPMVRMIYKIIGLASVIVGALLAARQRHFKRIAAYSSVSQMGYIILGLSAGTTLGLVGALAHVFSHAVFKSTLFSNAAALHEQVGILDITKLGGLEKKMPVTAFSSVIAFLSTAGIPPCSGFWSKLIIVLALWQSGNPVWAGAALLASILTSVYFLRLQKRVFFGKLPKELDDTREIGGSVKFIELLLTALTLGAGLLFPAALVYLQNLGVLV